MLKLLTISLEFSMGWRLSMHVPTAGMFHTNHQAGLQVNNPFYGVSGFSWMATDFRPTNRTKCEHSVAICCWIICGFWYRSQSCYFLMSNSAGLWFAFYKKKPCLVIFLLWTKTLFFCAETFTETDPQVFFSWGGFFYVNEGELLPSDIARN